MKSKSFLRPQKLLENLIKSFDIDLFLEESSAEDSEDFLEELKDTFLPKIVTIIYAAYLNHNNNRNKIDFMDQKETFNDVLEDEKIYFLKSYETDPAENKKQRYSAQNSFSLAV